jgi:hypothetical protein
MITMHLSACPVDLEEVTEEYVMGTLPQGQAIAFEDHYAGCDLCSAMLQRTAACVDAMRAAAKELLFERLCSPEN